MELSKTTGYIYGHSKRRTFIINFIYFGIIGVLCYIGLKKLLPILDSLHGRHGYCSHAGTGSVSTGQTHEGAEGRGRRSFVLLVFYGSILTIMCVSGSQILSSIQEQAKSCRASTARPSDQVCPASFPLLENSFPGHSIHISALGPEAWSVSWRNASVGISSGLLGWGASAISGIPALVLDFCHRCDRILFPDRQLQGRPLDFLLYQIPDDRRQMLTHRYFSISVKVACRLLRAYALLMLLTFYGTLYRFPGCWAFRPDSRLPASPRWWIFCRSLAQAPCFFPGHS